MNPQNTSGSRLVRASGGITYQPIYTFEDQLRGFADQFRADLLRSTTSPDWPPRGFQVSIDDGTNVRVRHIQQPAWHAQITGSNVFFQIDEPDSAPGGLAELLRVQSDLFAKVVTRLGIEALNSIGSKFVAAAPLAGPSVLDHLQGQLGLDPRQTLLNNRIGATTDAAFRIGYRLDTGAASLQVSADSAAEAYLVELDCYSWDTLGLGTDYLRFMLDAYRHYEMDVQRYVAALAAKEESSQVASSTSAAWSA